MAEVVNHTFSSSNTLIEDLKKKIKAVEKELETIASTVKDLSVSFPLIGQKEKEKKQLLLQLQSMQKSQKEAAQVLPMHVQMPYQPSKTIAKKKDLQIKCYEKNCACLCLYSPRLIHHSLSLPIILATNLAII